MSDRTRSALRGATCALAATLALLAGGAAAQESEPAQPAGAETAESEQPANGPPRDPLGRDTPRESVREYLESAREADWERAAQYLDLRRLPADERERRGPVLARHLKVVLDRTLWVDHELNSENPEGHADDGLPASRDRLGTIQTQGGPVDLLLERVSRDGIPVWLFAAPTVARIPDLYDEFGYGTLGEYLPSFFFRELALDVQLWQWAALLLVLLAAHFLSWLVARAVVGLVRPFAARSQSDIDDKLLAAVTGPLRLAAGVALFAALSAPVGLSVAAQRVVSGTLQALMVVAVTWLVMRIVDVFADRMERRLLAQGQTSATSLVPLGRKATKVFAVALATLAALDSFGFDVTALIAGLGVGGIAFALAAQKTIENLFGGATLIADRPVQVGDFCRFGDRVGTVEEIGLRSTRVRTLDRTLVSVPNAEFSTLQLENFTARDKIWFHPRLGLRYETTPEQMRYVLVELRRMLYAHPKVDPVPARVRFVGFGDFSLDLEPFVYVRSTDYGEFLGIAEDINLRIMDIVEASGTGFAFPSSTVYVAKDDGVDAERTKSAEQTVSEWRGRQEVFLPDFPPEAVKELADGIDFPEEGAPRSG